jgi:hypothetical protein
MSGLPTHLADGMGDSATMHETGNLPPDPRDAEALTITRRDLRIVVQGVLDAALPRLYGYANREIDRRLAKLETDCRHRADLTREQVATLIAEIKDKHVRLDEILWPTPK